MQAAAELHGEIFPADISAELVINLGLAARLWRAERKDEHVQSNARSDSRDWCAPIRLRHATGADNGEIHQLDVAAQSHQRAKGWDLCAVLDLGHNSHHQRVAGEGRQAWVRQNIR